MACETLCDECFSNANLSRKHNIFLFNIRVCICPFLNNVFEFFKFFCLSFVAANFCVKLVKSCKFLCVNSTCFHKLGIASFFEAMTNPSAKHSCVKTVVAFIFWLKVSRGEFKFFQKLNFFFANGF